MGKQQKYIKLAFLKLLKKQSIHKITVNTLTAEADVSRSCFYTYYTDKFELLEEIENDLINGFTSIMRSVRKHSADYFFEGVNNNSYPIYQEYFSYIKTHQELFIILLSPQAETNFTYKFMSAISRTRQETLDFWKLPQISDDFSVFNENLLASSYVSTFKTWLDQECQPDPQQMGEYLCSLWHPGFFYTERQYQEAIKYQKK